MLEAKNEPTKERKIDYLRLSITDRCNLRCIYCMPIKGVRHLTHDEILSYEELITFVKAAYSCGIRRVRVTGGEPLVRKGLVGFFEILTSVAPDLRVTLTTNGTLLSRYAYSIRKLGIERVNISLDSLDPEKYRRITRVGDLKDALYGIEKAIEVGFDPVKINVVVLSGINDDPFPFISLARRLPVHIRFIEYMPQFGEGSYYVSSNETLRRIQKVEEIKKIDPPHGWGPAEYYKVSGARGTIGFISPISCHICSSCNRLRLTSDGKLKTCLFEKDGFDIRGEMRGGANFERLREIITSQLERKKGGLKRKELINEKYDMWKIGG